MFELILYNSVYFIFMMKPSFYFYNTFIVKPVISIHYVTQVTYFFAFKIGDFKVAGLVCLQKKVCLPSLL